MEDRNWCNALTNEKVIQLIKEIAMRIFAALLLIGLAFETSATDQKNIKAAVQLQDKATNGGRTILKQTHE